MSLPDNRLRFPSTLIDFVQDVGIANQDHDNYPPPQGQARYDHMRMAIIALLSQQASYDEPTQFRVGSPWFDLNSMTLKIRTNDGWVNYSSVIPLGEPDSDGSYITLEEWYNKIDAAFSSLAQDAIFNGIATADGIIDVTIPDDLRQFVYLDTRCLFYVNGLLIDPRNCSLIGNSTIRLLHPQSLNKDDQFTVILKRIPINSFYMPTVSVP